MAHAGPTRPGRERAATPPHVGPAAERPAAAPEAQTPPESVPVQVAGKTEQRALTPEEAREAARRKEGQRGSISFRKKRTPRDVAPVDDAVSNVKLNTTLNERKPEPSWREEATKTWTASWRDIKNKVGYLEDIKDFPQVRNDIRLAEQDKYDAYEEGSKRIAHIVEPIVKSPSQRKAVGKIIMLEDMLDRSKRPRGTEEEIQDAVDSLAKAQQELRDAKGRDQQKAAGQRVGNASRALTMKLKPLENPLGFTADELQQAHDELIQRATPQMLESLKRHRDDAWRMLEDGVKRGYFDPKLLERKGETYFPHYVISQGDAIKDFIPGLPAAMREPFRAWAQMAVGSRKLIDFDYENAWRRHVIRTELANKIDDFMAKNLKRLDRMPAEGSAEYKQLFRNTDGSIPKPSELPYYSGGGGVITKYQYKGEPHVVYRYQPFRWTGIPKGRLMGMLQDSILKPFTDPYLVPERALKYLEVARRPEQYLWEKMWSNYVTGWKATQIVSGGLSTRTVNSFGDFYQLYLEDFPAFVMALPRMPAVMRAMFGTPRTAEEAEFQGLLKTHRITEGSTFFGPEAYKLRELWRESPPDQRVAMVLKHAFDIPGYVANALEVWPRVTKAYADFLRIKAGKPLASKVYSIEGLSPYEQMGVLARNTFVDYAAVSPFHQQYLRKMYFPFLTWFQRTFTYTLGHMAKNPLNFGMKVALPAAAMWYWNNVMNPDLERDQPEWVKRFVWHISTNVAHPLNPETKTTIVFPTGNDMALEVLQVPAMMERVGMFMRGDRSDVLNFNGWSSVAATMLNIAKTMGQRLVDLSPITEAIGSVWANHDARTGEPVVPRDYVGDPVKSSYYQATYVAMKAIPVFERVFQQMKKDAKRPGGFAATPYGRFYEALVARGVFNPMYGPMSGFAFPIDPSVAQVNHLREANDAYDTERREGGATFMDALADQLSHKNPQAIREWAKANPEAMKLLGPQGIAARVMSPENLQTLFETLESRAQTPEARESFRRKAKAMDLWRRWESFLGSPVGTRSQALLDLLRQRRGIPPHPPEQSLTGESTLQR